MGTPAAFTWEAAADATHYDFSLTRDGDSASAALPDLTPESDGDALTCAADCTLITAGSAAEALLTVNDAYTWDVDAKNSSGTTQTPPFTFTFTVPLAPGAFALLSPPDGDDLVGTPAAFTWEASSLATSYNFFLERGDDFISLFGDTPQDDTDTLTCDTVCTLTVADSEIEAFFTESGLYVWTAEAENSFGVTETTTFTFTFTLDTAPGAFALLTPPDGSIQPGAPAAYTWDAASGAATYDFTISRGLDAQSVSLTGLTPLSDADPLTCFTACTLTVIDGQPLDDFTAINDGFTWEVTAVNANGSTPAESFSFATVSPPPSFALLTPSAGAALGAAPAAFTWEASSAASSYELVIARSGSVDGLSVPNLTPDADADALACDSLTCTLTTASSGTLAGFISTPDVYTWGVFARNGGGATPSASSFTFTLSAAANLIANPGFEDGITGWTPTVNSSNDGVVKNKTNRPDGKPDKIFARSGIRAFRLTGEPGEDTRVAQVISVAGMQAGDTLTLRAWIEAKSLASGVQLRLIVKYGGLPGAKISTPVPAGTAPYTEYSAAVTLDAAPTKVKVQVRYRNGVSAAGRMLVDDVSLVRTPVAAR